MTDNQLSHEVMNMWPVTVWLFYTRIVRLQRINGFRAQTILECNQSALCIHDVVYCIIRNILRGKMIDPFD